MLNLGYIDGTYIAMCSTQGKNAFLTLVTIDCIVLWYLVTRTY